MEARHVETTKRNAGHEDFKNGWVRATGRVFKAHRNDQVCAQFFDTREEADAWVNE